MMRRFGKDRQHLFGSQTAKGQREPERKDVRICLLARLFKLRPRGRKDTHASNHSHCPRVSYSKPISSRSHVYAILLFTAFCSSSKRAYSILSVDPSVRPTTHTYVYNNTPSRQSHSQTSFLSKTEQSNEASKQASKKNEKSSPLNFGFCRIRVCLVTVKTTNKSRIPKVEEQVFSVSANGEADE